MTHKDFTIKHLVTHLKASRYIKEFRDVERVEGYCKGCDRYGQCWACPPFSFDTTEYLSGYRVVHLIGTKVMLSEQLRESVFGDQAIADTSNEVMRAVRAKMDERLLELEAIFPNSKLCFAGTCLLCRDGCKRKQNLACLSPHKVRPSLEALGFDIVKSAQELLHTEVKWSKDTLPEYLILVSALFAQEPLTSMIQLD